MGQNIGYIRVSTSDQSLLRQLTDVKLDKVFEDKYGAMKAAERDGLMACLDYIRSGDTLHVHSIDRLARSLRDLQAIVDGLVKNGVTIVFHTENLVFNGDDNPMSTLILQMLGAFAQFERSITRARQREGIDAAMAAGTFRGRPNNFHKADEVKRMKSEGVPMQDIAAKFKITTRTAYNLLNLQEAKKPKLLVVSG